MNALLRGKREWEHWNQEQLNIVVDQSTRFLRKLMKRTAVIISFLLFLIYKGGSHLLWLIAASLQGNRPMIQKEPGHFVELSEEYSSLHNKEFNNPYLRK